MATKERDKHQPDQELPRSVEGMQHTKWHRRSGSARKIAHGVPGNELWTSRQGNVVAFHSTDDPDLTLDDAGNHGLHERKGEEEEEDGGRGAEGEAAS